MPNVLTTDTLAQSGFGSYAIGAGNAVTAGQLGNLAELTGSSEGGTDVAMNMAKDNSLPYFLGELTGSTLGTLGTGAALKGASGVAKNPSVAALLANPVTADAAYGAAYGASQADDPLYGAMGGAAAALGGGWLGGKIGQRVSGMRTPPGGDPLNRGERSIMNALNKGDRPTVEAALLQAQELGVPASLADMSPEVGNLTGAAIRRSPTAGGMARDVIGRRNQGQMDRFRGAVERDLGPLDNVPERSNALIQQAQEASSPLYAQAYAAPVVSTPKIESLLATPFGRQGLGYAETIAANEGRNPRAMGFALDEAGSPVLNPIPSDALAVLGAAESKVFQAENAMKRAQAGQLTGSPAGNVSDAEAAYEAARAELAQAQANMSAQPSIDSLAASPGYTTQTIDYAKRGMDKVLEQYRNPITGKLMLDDLGRSENAALRALLQEVDAVNPAFGKARAAYAGPASEREALLQGQDAWTQNTDMLAIQAGRQTPERLGQMQLGSRDSLVKKGEGLSKSTNPFRVLNTDANELRLAALYPNKADEVARLLAQRDMEMQMAASGNRLIGNSMTAERNVADQAFDEGGVMRPAIEGMVETAVTGAPVVAALRSGVGRRIADALMMGAGKRAIEKADQIAPVALNTNPGDVIAQILAMDERSAAFEAAMQELRQQGRRPGQVAGSALAASSMPY